MTKQELDTIKLYLNELEKVDFDKYITERFPNTPLENVMFRECNAIEFKKLYKSIIKRFETLIYSDIAIMLPICYYFNNSSYGIITVIKDLKDRLIGKDYNENIFDSVNEVFDYCIQFGNWDKNLIYKPSFSQEKIEKLAEEIQLIQTKLNQENERLKGLLSEYSKSKNDLDNKINQASEFYDTIKEKAKSATDNDSLILSYHHQKPTKTL